MKNNSRILSINEIASLLDLQIEEIDGQRVVRMRCLLTPDSNARGADMLALDNLIPRLLHIEPAPPQQPVGDEDSGAVSNEDSGAASNEP